MYRRTLLVVLLRALSVFERQRTVYRGPVLVDDHAMEMMFVDWHRTLGSTLIDCVID